MKTNRSTMVLGVLLLCSALCAASSSIAKADTSEAATPSYSGGSVQTSTGSAEALPNGLLDDLYVNYFAIFHGPNTDRLSSPYTVTRTGDVSKTSAMNFDSEITAAYMITKDIGVGPVIPFLLVPTLGQGAIMGDAGIKVFDKKAVDYQGFTAYTNLILQAPTSDFSSNRHMKYAVKMTPYARYDVPKSRFSFGTWTEAKAYIGVTASQSFKLYAAPYVSYQLTPRVSANLEYEMDSRHNVHGPAFDLTNYQTDLMPGFVWMVAPHVMINPYVQLFTGNKVTLGTSAVGAVISATLL